MSFKLAACLVGGFLFFVSGCSSFITVDSGATPVQVEINSNPAPDNKDELVVAAVTPITSPNLEVAFKKLSCKASSASISFFNNLFKRENALSL